MRKIFAAFMLVFIMILVTATCFAGTPETQYDRFSVSFEQDGVIVSDKNHIVNLQKKPFTIIVTFQGYKRLPVAVRLKPSASDTYYNQALNGRLSSTLAETGIGMAEPAKPESQLYLKEEKSVHYWSYYPSEGGRFHEVTIKGNQLIGRRNVESLRVNYDNIRIENWAGNELYLVFLNTSPLTSARWSHGKINQVEYYKIQFPVKTVDIKIVPVQDNATEAKQWLERGDNLWISRDYNGAIVAYGEAIARNKKFSEAYVRRANLYQFLGKYELALADCAALIRLEPRKAGYYHQRAVVYENMRQFDAALKDYSRAIRLDPGNGFAYYYRANIYRMKGQFKKALSDYTAALPHYSRPCVVYTDRGNIYMKMGKVDEAINDYNDAICLDSGYSDAYLGRGIAYYNKGLLDLAIADYAKVMELDPINANAYYLRGLLYKATKQFGLAEADLTKALMINPKNVDALIRRGEIYRDQGKIAAALTDLTKAIELNSGNSDAFFYRGLTYQTKGDLDQAIIDYTRAIDNNHRNGDAYFRRAGIYKRKGELKLALADYNSAINVNPEYTEAYLDKGFIYKELGRKAEAVRAFKDFLSHAKPNDPAIETAKREIKGLGGKY